MLRKRVSTLRHRVVPLGILWNILCSPTLIGWFSRGKVKMPLTELGLRDFQISPHFPNLSPLLSSAYSGKVPQEGPGAREAAGGADNGLYSVSGSQGGWVWACQETELEEA